MIILGELILGYIAAIVVGKFVRKRKSVLYLLLILISAIQVACVLHAMFTNELEIPTSS